MQGFQHGKDPHSPHGDGGHDAWRDLVVEAHIFLGIADLRRAHTDLADLCGGIGREGLDPLADQDLAPVRLDRRVRLVDSRIVADTARVDRGSFGVEPA